MPDTKISALTAVTAVAGANEFAVNEAGVSKKATSNQVKTFITDAPVFAAGSANASTKPKLTSGTLMTTPEAGALEYDGTCFYITPVASNRGVALAEHFVCLTSTYTLTSQTAAQKLFNATANGELTLPVGAYFFECMFSLSSMSATSGNSQFRILGGGTAVLGSVLYHAVGIDNAINAAAAQTGGMSNQSNSPASIVSAATNATQNTAIRGTFRVTTTGTIIPSVALVTAAAAVVAIGSYFRCWCVGDQNVTTVGNWS